MTTLRTFFLYTKKHAFANGKEVPAVFRHNPYFKEIMRRVRNEKAKGVKVTG